MWPQYTVFSINFVLGHNSLSLHMYKEWRDGGREEGSESSWEDRMREEEIEEGWRAKGWTEEGIQIGGRVQEK